MFDEDHQALRLRLDYFMRRFLLIVLGLGMLLPTAEPAFADSCSPDGLGGYYNSDGSSSSPDGLGGFSNSDGNSCSPDGLGGFYCN